MKEPGNQGFKGSIIRELKQTCVSPGSPEALIPILPSILQFLNSWNPLRR